MELESHPHSDPVHRAEAPSHEPALFVEMEVVASADFEVYAAVVAHVVVAAVAAVAAVAVVAVVPLLLFVSFDYKLAQCDTDLHKLAEGDAGLKKKIHEVPSHPRRLHSCPLQWAREF